MLNVVQTIVPVFAAILLGWALCHAGFLPSTLIGHLNRLVYYLALPAMIFREVASASFAAHFHPLLLAGTLLPVLLIFALSLGIGRVFSIPRPELGTFLQTSFHGNLGYIGLAVCYYLLGERGFTQASILAGFLMLLQNFLGVVALQAFSFPGEGGRDGGNGWSGATKVFLNPVIVSALAGIGFSLSGLALPVTVDRFLKIISGMALPLALLVIGASLSFRLIRANLRSALGAGALKLLVLPAAGLTTYRWFGFSPQQFLPGLILLAAPTATITYVMASEMKGSADLASAAVSMNTVLSALTFVFWLSFYST